MKKTSKNEAILYDYRKGIYAPFQKTYRDPYWKSGKSRNLTVVEKWKVSVC